MKKPNYTQVSNEFIARMPELSGAAVKIFVAVSRQTIGYHKDCEIMSQGELMQATGLSLNSVKSAVKELEDQELIRTWKKGTGKSTKTFYELYFADSMSKIDIEGDSNGSKIDTLDSFNGSKIDTLDGFNGSKIDTFFKEKEIRKEINVKKDTSAEKSKNDIEAEKPFSLNEAISAWNLAAGCTGSKLMRYRYTALNVKRPGEILTVLAAYTGAEVVEAVKNYDKILQDDKYEPWPEYTGFEGFIIGGVEKYIDEARPFDRCRIGGPEGETVEQRMKRLNVG